LKVLNSVYQWAAQMASGKAAWLAAGKDAHWADSMVAVKAAWLVAGKDAHWADSMVARAVRTAALSALEKA
jgi:hypothetical protein